MQAISVKERKTGISEVSSCGGIYYSKDKPAGIIVDKILEMLDIKTFIYKRQFAACFVRCLFYEIRAFE